MNVLVTGGAGFIGANLCRVLGSTDGFDEVIVLDDLSTGSADNLAGLEAVELIEGTILDSSLVCDVVSRVDAVVHLAARPSVPRSLADPVATHEANASGTLAVLEAVRRLSPKVRPHLIVASSSSVYGANPAIPKREDMVTMPASPYAASKLASEAYALAYARSFSLDVLVFRFFNVFGPLQRADHAYAAVVPRFLSAALRGDPLTIHGDGTQTRDFTFVGSVISVLLDALCSRTADVEPVNLAFGSRVSILALSEVIETLVGHPLEREHVERRAGDVDHSQADQTRLRAIFPDADPVPLEEGLRLTLEWTRESWT